MAGSIATSEETSHLTYQHGVPTMFTGVPTMFTVSLRPSFLQANQIRPCFTDWSTDLAVHVGLPVKLHVLVRAHTVHHESLVLYKSCLS